VWPATTFHYPSADVQPPRSARFIAADHEGEIVSMVPSGGKRRKRARKAGGRHWVVGGIPRRRPPGAFLVDELRPWPTTVGMLSFMKTLLVPYVTYIDIIWGLDDDINAQ
jgi:hypothetical protein